MPNTSPRLGIVTPTGGEAPNTNVAYKTIADTVDALAAIYGQGTLAARPVSTPGSPGKQGRFYMVTSGAETGELYYDYGTGWLLVNPDQAPADNSITLAKMADNSVSSAEIVDGSVRGSDGSDVQREILQASIRFIDLAAHLKPSQGASGAAEALRALGTAAGTAAAGTHAAQHGNSGADPLPAGVGAKDYGAALPAAGLYNGYRFTYFDSGLAFDLVYRADLDATYPWHVVGGQSLSALVASIPPGNLPGTIGAFAGAPSVAIPKGMVCLVEFGCRIHMASTRGAQFQLTGPGVAAGASVLRFRASDTAEASVASFEALTFNAAGNVSVIGQKINGDVDALVDFWIRVTPRRMAA